MKDFTCIQCKNIFKEYPANRQGKLIFCSFKCKGAYQSIHYLGENNPCWRNGRYGYVCKVCGENKKGLKEYNVCIECKNGHANWKGGVSKSESYRKWYLNNKTKRRISNERRKNNLLQIEGSHTNEEWEQLKKTYQYMCLCCKRVEPEIKLTEDHIIPVSKNGTDYIWNIQPLCNSCNARKKVKIIDYREEVLSNPEFSETNY